MWTASEIAYTASVGAALTYLVYALPTLHTFGMGAIRSVGLFWWRVLGGILYGWVHIKSYAGGDTYSYFLYSKAFTDALHNGHWHCFFRLLLLPNGGYLTYPCYEYAYNSSYWDHSPAFFILRIHALMRLVSGGYFLVHTLLWGLGMFIATNLLYRVLCERYTAYKYLWLSFLFIFPSLWFWTGGIHKEGLIFGALSVLLYALHQLDTNRQHSKLRYGVYIGISLLVLGIVRSYVLLLLIPALLCYGLVVVRQPNVSAVKYFLSLYGVGALLVLLANRCIPDVQLFERLASQRAAFMWESGGSEFTNELWAPTLSGFVGHLPAALSTVLARPFIWESHHVLAICSAVENGILLFVLGYMLLHIRRPYKVSAFACLLLFFAISYLVLIGTLVPNVGTMLRYRIIGILFLLLGVACIYAKPTDQ